jgi:hypothetical protein
VLDRSTTSLALTVASAVTASTAKPLTAHSLSHSQSHKNGQAAPALPKAVVAPGQKLSAEWLRLYLAHLRLSQRAAAAASAGGQVGGGRGVPSFPTQSISRSIGAKARRSLSSLSLSLAPSAAAAAAAATQKRPAVPKSGGDGDGDLSGLKAAAGGLGDEPPTDSAALALLPAPSTMPMPMPMPWLDWLGAPLPLDPRATAGGKSSRAFKKALAGVPHSLSREDVNRILEGHEIAPAAAVEAEVAHRVRCWVLDTRCAEPLSLLLSYPHAASYLLLSPGRLLHLQRPPRLRARCEQAAAGVGGAPCRRGARIAPGAARDRGPRRGRRARRGARRHPPGEPHQPYLLTLSLTGGRAPTQYTSNALHPFAPPRPFITSCLVPPQELCEAKTAEWRAAERSRAAVTKELYWKVPRRDGDCPDPPRPPPHTPA